MRDFGVPLFRASSELLLKDHFHPWRPCDLLAFFGHTFVNTLAVVPQPSRGEKKPSLKFHHLVF